MTGARLGRRAFCRGVVAAGLGVVGYARAGAQVRPNGFDSLRYDVGGSVAPTDVSIDAARLDDVYEFVSAELDAGPCPGATFAATRYGKTFAERCWGTFAGTDRAGIPCTPEVQFPLYSFTKSITATVAAMVHDEGKFAYDDPVAEYIPGFEAHGKEAVTIRQLLTHSAGLNSIGLEYVGDEESWARVLQSICDAPLEWEPGSKTLYHAISGMLLVADLIRRVSENKPWPEICAERIFVPLGADGFTFAPDFAGAEVAVTPPPAEFPYSVDREHFPFLGHPSGGAYGRTRDLLKLLNLNLNGGIWQGKTLLNPDTLAEMHRIQYQAQIDRALAEGQPPVHEFWGLGWLHRGTTTENWFGFGDKASPETFGHAGIDTVIGLADPTRGVAMVFITSASPGEAAATMRLRNGVTNRLIAAVDA